MAKLIKESERDKKKAEREKIRKEKLESNLLK